MSETTGALEPEEYKEPNCLLCGDPYGAEPKVKPVPQQRIVEKLDEYMSRRDYAGAERHLLYWLEEARLGGDLRGELVISNELAGHYRKTGNRDKAVEFADRALALLDRLDFDGTRSAGTTYVNAATAHSAFGEDERALELFGKARSEYEALPDTPAHLLGGLYNNMALCCRALGRTGDAFSLFEKAMEQMARVPNGALEQAITCLNMADTVAQEKGLEEGEARIGELLDRASELLDTPGIPHDGYYAFVCEKCAPSFSYYGYFLEAEELQNRAKAIYERA